MPENPPRRLRSCWPWVVVALTAIPAVWHVVDFPEDVDPEFPTVDRPTFNPMPPPAYRLAEPGDTLDRVGIYYWRVRRVVLAGVGLLRSRGGVGLWPSAIVLGCAGLWHAATPGPTFDGWHGLGWRAILDPTAPRDLRIGLAIAATAAAAVVVGNAVGFRRSILDRGRALGTVGLFGFAAIMIVGRQFDPPEIGPPGYWPRWCFIWGMLAIGLGLVRALLAQGMPRPAIRAAWALGGGLAWLGMVVGCVGVSWQHRPLDRLREVEPGRIYISAMPTYRGLEVAHARIGFRTIINIFPEDTYQRSPRLPDEHRFVREHGIRYVEASARDNDSDEFLDRSLALARDPEAWPILLHCHGSMDRSPGWMGVYRFLVQGRPLDAIMREIEGHRGYRPKASITLMFNRVLGGRAPDRYRADPTGRRLLEAAHGVTAPHRREGELISRAGTPPTRP